MALDIDNTIIVGSIILATLIAYFFLFKKEKTALNPKEFIPFKLTEIEVLSHDTKRFTFALQTPTTKLGLPVGQHITFRGKDKNGKVVQRSYTPTTGDETIGEVKFVIKMYRAGVHPKFPDGGKMSHHLDNLKVGDTLDMKGPKGHLTYLGKGKFTIQQVRKPLEERSAKHFGMIAGGTGITPMLQVLDAIFKYTDDTTTTANLLFANQTEDDILVREELEDLEKKFPGRFKLHYTLDRPSKGWKYSTGFIDKDMIAKYVLKDGSVDGSQVFMCGPPAMIKFACLPNLKELGCDKKTQFSF